MLKCIIIPAYNEFENINLILKEIYQNNFEDIRVVIVDDSKENFEKKIRFEKHRFVYLHRGKKLGRGSAVLFGIKYMLTLHNDIDFFVEMDSDMSHNPNELVRNISYFKDNDLDLLIASRYKKDSKIINWPIKRKVLSFFSNKLTKYTLEIPITDYTNGYRIYSFNAAKFIVKNCGKIGDGYIVLSEILVQLYYNNFKVDEIDTIFVNRVRGTSNATFSEILSSLFGLYKIWGEKKKITKY